MLNVKLLKGKMAEHGLSQKQLAERIGLSDNTMSSRMLSRTPLNLDEIDKICEVLSINEPMEKIKIFLFAPSQNRDKTKSA